MNPKHAVADAHSSPGELEELQRLHDEADIAQAREREASPTGPALTHDAFMARLEAEERGEAAS
ncbi:hypothetical protein [Streptomyces sp. NBC_00286]|uniref:hypothetical protein n=1 Tax=Streptomyces sp. NBC_00286 TaxID=2975701 RepID=UPI002E2CC4B1|nr:hypothetical protein [Streptomyces sp. NBC_00286]